MGYKYMLMNRDTVVARFGLDSIRMDTFEKLPYGFKNIFDWLGRRIKTQCLRDHGAYLRTLGLNDKAGFIKHTHLVSINDNFWVKETDSDLTWDAVSPFKHEYSEALYIYTLEGSQPKIECDSTYSPVIGSVGSFPHGWRFNGGKPLFSKAGSKYTLGGCNSGREPFSEYYASIVARYLGFDCVKYDIREHVRQNGSVEIITGCECYCTEDIGSVCAYYLGLDTYESVLGFCGSLGDKTKEKFLNMLFLDCLLMNVDRHFGNIEFLVNNKTLRVIDLAPIFDNNMSMVPRFIDGYDTFDESDYRAADGRPFDSLYNLVIGHKSYREQLISLRELRLVKPDTVEINKDRIEFLNWFLQIRVDKLLEMEEALK